MSARKRKSTTNPGTLRDAKIVVGIDFGTAFTGFAYAEKANPGEVFTFYEWPARKEALGKLYCKTQTSLWYLPDTFDFDLQDWGWPAQVNYVKRLQNMNVSDRPPRGGLFITKFKMHVDATGSTSGDSKSTLPQGLPVQKMISDYLKEMSKLIMAELRIKFGPLIKKKDVKWCLTVPSIWTDAQKQTMKDCAQMAGLVCGRLCRDADASLHEIEMVLEPEAASVYCLQNLTNTNLRKGSKFLVVDAGGGTVDLVVHEKMDDSGLRVKELTVSKGEWCGGTFVDSAFIEYLSRKIGCFEKFKTEYPETILKVYRNWENIKCNFDGQHPHTLEVPIKLARAWETYQMENGIDGVHCQYDEIVITREKMKMIFEETVCKILNLIREQLKEVPEIQVIMVTGGFSNSPYLMQRIRNSFSSMVKQIISPPDPGSAVCQGAVTFGLLGKDIIMSRKSRKTYGIAMHREFRRGDPPGSMVLDDDGEALCTDSFGIFTRIGDDVPVDHCETHAMVPMNKRDRNLKLTIYSTSDPMPKFVTDPGVAKVGSWSLPLPAGGKKRNQKPEVDVTMYFGRTHIELSAKPRDPFVGGKTSKFSAVFDREYVP